MNQQKGVDRRGSYRVQVNLPARYSSEAATVYGWVANLSHQGLFLRSQYLDDNKEEVDISFDLPGEANPVAVRGRVVRVHDGPLCPGMAIRFTQVPDAAGRKLAEFLSRRTRTLPTS